MALHIARDSAAADHLVHGWSLGTVADDIEITCADDEQVVLCPAWAVGERLGPGTHTWRNPDLSRPAAAYFVLTSPVEVPFELVTRFMLPSTRRPVQLRAQGSVMVRAADAAILVAQFVGLPFDDLNRGLLRSVSASVERIAARLLTHRVVELGDPEAVTHPAAVGELVDDLVSYGPTAGAVFGLELTRFLGLEVAADDGQPPGPPSARRRTAAPTRQGWAGGPSGAEVVVPDAAAWSPSADATIPAIPTPIPAGWGPGDAAEAKPRGNHRAPTLPSMAPLAVPPPTPGPPLASRAPGDGAIPHEIAEAATPPAGVRSGMIGIGVGRIGEAAAHAAPATPAPRATTPEPVVDGFDAGARVLVAGPDGRLVAAVVRTRQAGYYQLEIGGSGEVVWVPQATVVAEPS
ncbi:MAG: hypothetical protein R2939_14850 [Kofleriaceae bacterium]